MSERAERTTIGADIRRTAPGPDVQSRSRLGDRALARADRGPYSLRRLQICALGEVIALIPADSAGRRTIRRRATIAAGVSRHRECARYRHAARDRSRVQTQINGQLTDVGFHRRAAGQKGALPGANRCAAL